MFPANVFVPLYFTEPFVYEPSRCPSSNTKSERLITSEESLDVIDVISTISF